MKSKKILLSFCTVIVIALMLAFVSPLVGLSGTTGVAYAAVGSYYSSVTATSGKALLGQLHDLIVTTRTSYSSYDDCRDKGHITDPGQESNTVMDFYTQADINKNKWDVSGGWNREHVWPKANSNGLWKDKTVGGGADLHHIRPSEKDINNKRGNQKYGEASNKSPVYATDISGIIGGYSSGGVFEPTDNVKGDVARICMYVYTHYNTYSNVGGTTNGSGNSSYFGTLKFTDNISASSEDAAIKLLLKWNKLDPVDDIERNRNEAVYNIQHNRNPFIDNENYAEAIWGGGTMEQVDLEGLTLNSTALTLTVGQAQTLSVTAIPSNANAGVTWSSSNTSVATVVNGKVTAVSNGTATITATSTQNASIKVTATVTVTTQSEKISGFVNNVSAISSATTLRQRFDAIKTALSDYQQLTAAEKADSNAQGAYQTLQSAINSYNADIAAQNAVMENATKTGAYAVVGATLALAALVVVLQRKFN